MPRTQTASRRIGRNAQMALPRAARASAAVAMPALVAVVPILIPARPMMDLDEEPKRGVPLKSVASFMMAMALMCLLALIAGRVDASRAEVAPAGGDHGASATMAASGNGSAATAADALDSDAD
jgi:hypothetical protein